MADMISKLCKPIEDDLDKALDSVGMPVLVFRAVREAIGQPVNEAVYMAVYGAVDVAVGMAVGWHWR